MLSCFACATYGIEESMLTSGEISEYKYISSHDDPPLSMVFTNERIIIEDARDIITRYTIVPYTSIHRIDIIDKQLRIYTRGNVGSKRLDRVEYMLELQKFIFMV